MSAIHLTEEEQAVSPLCEQIQMLKSDFSNLTAKLWTVVDGIDNRMYKFQDTILGKVEQLNGRSLDVMSKLIQSEKSKECSFADKFEQEIIKIWDVIKTLQPENPNPRKMPYVCPVCQPRLLNEAMAQVHLKINPDKPFICPACKGKGIVWG